MDLQQIRGVVFDMDGVLWRGDQPLPGLQAMFTFLQARALPYALATNNSRKTQAAYVTKLAQMGVMGVAEASIMTSSIATASHMQTLYPSGSRMYVVGGNGIRDALERAGFILAEQDVSAVVVGIDLEFSYAKARVATRLLLNGADFIATNGDKTLPVEDGFAPGAGSIVAMLEASSSKTARIIGKPHRAMFDAAVRQMGTAPHETLMVGDRLNTDIEGAYYAGLKTALVLSGVATRTDAAHYPIQPDAIYENLADLLEHWQ